MAHEEIANAVKDGKLEGKIEKNEDVPWLKEVESKLMELTADLECQYTEKLAALNTFEQACRAKGAVGKSEFFAKKAEYQSWKAKTSRYKVALASRLRQVRGRLRDLSGNRIKELEERVEELEFRTSSVEDRVGKLEDPTG